jgi:hypothetical protein
MLIRIFALALSLCVPALAQTEMGSTDLLSGLPAARDYVQKRSSSYDRSGGNADYRALPAGQTLTVLDTAGPGIITHIWFTISSPEKYHLKTLVLRAYWDGEPNPSVETPIGDFFGLGLGEYVLYQSLPLQVAPNNALNAFFPMPFQKAARLTVTNEGTQAVDAAFFNIDYRIYKQPLPTDTLYFHAQYRQASPAKGWTNKPGGDPEVEGRKNLDGADNYVWLEAAGRGHFVGVTMSVLQNQDNWW